MLSSASAAQLPSTDPAPAVPCSTNSFVGSPETSILLRPPSFHSFANDDRVWSGGVSEVGHEVLGQEGGETGQDQFDALGELQLLGPL